jgi:hypothetical protein
MILYFEILLLEIKIKHKIKINEKNKIKIVFFKLNSIFLLVLSKIRKIKDKINIKKERKTAGSI